jgi:hypothetical protein
MDCVVHTGHIESLLNNFHVTYTETVLKALCYREYFDFGREIEWRKLNRVEVNNLYS